MTEILRGDEAEAKALKLKKISFALCGWVTKFRDESTGEIWILDYPESESHGGGSSRLTLVGTNRVTSTGT